MKRSTALFAVTILLLFFISACNTSKNADRNVVARGFDDLMARDNGYFNARMIMRESEKTLWTDQVENYEEVLPIFKYGTQEMATGIQSQMDEVINKCSFVIQMHKKSKWVDDSYFLIGKSYFYERNYDNALATFQQIVTDYSNLIEKQSKSKRIKEDEDGELTFFEKFKHHPVSTEAGIWVARTLTEKKKYSEAHTVISVLKSKENFPQWMLGELYAVEADGYMKQGQLENAIEPLTEAIKYTEDKKLKGRYHFILAQLYALQKDNAKAMKEYQAVLETKPSYDMDFYAKLNMAKLSLSEYGVSGRESKEELLSLLNDEKYRDFYGLIYYTLADIAFAAKDDELGISYLNQCIRSTNDGKQRGLAYMKLGDIQYAMPEYKMAYAYYDSTVNTLPNEHDRYKEVKTLRDNLKILVDELTIIETEKKLQYWASLPEKELYKELEKIVPETEEKDTTNNTTLPANTNTLANTNTGGEFYFYNTTLRSRGFSEFKKTWGTRKLEDNWRRSDKNTFSEESEETGEETAEASIDLSGKNLSIEKIIQSLPKTPEEISASNAKIAAALFRSGMIYKENFRDNQKAIGQFEENINDYPGNNYEVQSLFQLYGLTNPPKKDAYKDRILKEYPDSDYAKVIKDPDYFREKEKAQKALDTYYAETYAQLQAHQYAIVKARVAASDSLFPSSVLKPKFDMLNALADADSIDLFKNSLQAIAIKYPQHEVGAKAQEILDYLRRGSVLEDAGKGIETASYNFNANEEQYFMFVMQGTGKNATTLKNNLATFNSTAYASDNLKISSMLLGKENSLILVKSFSNAEEAMLYYYAAKDNTGIFKDLEKTLFTPMVISKSNYVQFFKVKDVAGYELYFEENYLDE